MANSLVGKHTDKYQMILGNEAINSRQITQWGWKTNPLPGFNVNSSVWKYIFISNISTQLAATCVSHTVKTELNRAGHTNLVTYSQAC